MTAKAVLGARLQLIERPSRLGNTNDWYIEPFVTNQSLQRGKNLLVGKVARGAKENDRIGDRAAHSRICLACGFSIWPPNSYRIADKSLSAYSASPREFEPSK